MTIQGVVITEGRNLVSNGPMAPAVVLVASGEIELHQYFDLLTSSATTVRARWGGSDASQLVGG